MTDLGALQRRVDSIVWYHSIDLGQGIVTNGFAKSYLPTDQLPSFENKSVLDVGAWDGYYSFLAERAGAARVVALDHYVWGVDFARRNPYWIECFEKGVLPDHGRDLTEFWDPAMPGMAGFQLARETLGSRVEAAVGDLATMDVAPLGRFDVVLFLGVLYHLKEPLGALERLRQLTGEVAVIETEALHLPAHDDQPLLEFTAGCYGDGYDYSNWYTPTIGGLHELCRAAGFTRVDTVIGPPEPPPVVTPSMTALARGRRAVRRQVDAIRSRPAAAHPRGTHYRALLHAYP